MNMLVRAPLKTVAERTLCHLGLSVTLGHLCNVYLLVDSARVVGHTQSALSSAMSPLPF